MITGAKYLENVLVNCRSSCSHFNEGLILPMEGIVLSMRVSLLQWWFYSFNEGLIPSMLEGPVLSMRVFYLWHPSRTNRCIWLGIYSEEETSFEIQYL